MGYLKRPEALCKKKEPIEAVNEEAVEFDPLFSIITTQMGMMLERTRDLGREVPRDFAIEHRTDRAVVVHHFWSIGIFSDT